MNYVFHHFLMFGPLFAFFGSSGWKRTDGPTLHYLTEKLTDCSYRNPQQNMTQITCKYIEITNLLVNIYALLYALTNNQRALRCGMLDKEKGLEIKYNM